MNSKRIISSFIAAALSFNAITALNHSIKTFNVSAEENQSEATVSFDSTTGTLYLSGNVKLNEVQEYKENEQVKVIIAKEGAILPVNCNGLFSEFKATEINLKNADSSKVTYMDSMFFDCSSLKKLDISNFNTSNVISMCKTFAWCSALESLDASIVLAYYAYASTANDDILSLEAFVKK
jgi:surface protein